MAVTSQLIGTDFTSGTQLPNYVNGRLLTAEDLATSQASLHKRDTWIGRAAGHGVVTGLWVTSTAISLAVAPGLGISPSGEPVRVANAITLPLTIAGAPATATGADFACCGTLPSGPSTSITAGDYLLAVRPACQLSGQAALAGTPGSSAPAGCTAQWKVDGVQFTVIALPELTTVGGVPVTAQNRRNLLANWCYGADQLARLGTDPFGFTPAYGGFDSLDPADLTGCDVPLAVFHWDGQSISDLDNWSARRRVTAPDPVTVSWSAELTDRRVADGQARFLQFQDQVAGVLAEGKAGGTQAPDVFGLLPPAGFLPVVIRNLAPSLRDQLVKVTPSIGSIEVAGGQSGFTPSTFFGHLAVYGGVLDWEVADLALQQSFRRSPVPAGGQQQEPPSGGAPLTYYFILQNVLGTTQQGAGAVVIRRPLPLTARSPYYMIFVKNYPILSGTHPPVVAPVIEA
jgi:uncharacterized Zn-binding protein involved in type VI secretion